MKKYIFTQLVIAVLLSVYTFFAWILGYICGEAEGELKQYEQHNKMKGEEL